MGDPGAPATEAQVKTAVATFYWQYAALAADVYDQNRPISNNSLLLSSSWLLGEVERSGPTAQAQYLALRSSHGKITRMKADASAHFKDDQPPANLDPFEEGLPTSSADCDPADDTTPVVPLKRAARSYHWQRVPEFTINTQARDWSFFVPDLAIEVWRRPRSPDGSIIEYAIVYRGTTGKGGWVSNLRGITSITPLTWDQYRQARRATQQIVDQAKRLHEDGNKILGVGPKTTLRFTTVGHSLGAGIAAYVYTQVPQVTRSVGFDPSPIDGSSWLDVRDRRLVMTAGGPRRDSTPKGRDPKSAGANTDSSSSPSPTDLDAERAIDSDGLTPPASVYKLYEKGEAISRFFPCQSGTMWGDEGGPNVSCESVNFLKGNWVQQHSMARMACMLYLARKGYFEVDGVARYEAFLKHVHENKEDPAEESFDSF